MGRPPWQRGDAYGGDVERQAHGPQATSSIPMSLVARASTIVVLLPERYPFAAGLILQGFANLGKELSHQGSLKHEALVH